MPKSKINYSFFSSFAIRTPVYPIDFYRNITSGLSIESNEIKEILKKDEVIEALFLASPELYAQIQKWMTDELYSVDKSNKIKLSVLKYLIRMATRCTPFGLFAACGSGKLSDNNNLTIAGHKSFYRQTRFDMQFLVNLANGVANDARIQNKLLFYPNSTLYKLGDFYRYIEYFLYENKRKYSLEALRNTEYLDLILQKATTGSSKNELAAALISDEINIDEAYEFIEELISNQIIVSELETTLTGGDLLTKFFSNAKEKESENDSIADYGQFLVQLNQQLNQTDAKQNNSISSYQEITETITETGILFDKKYLFQTDLFIDSKNFELDKKYTYELSKAIALLHKIYEKPQNTDLENFKKAFVERYESESISLVKALDIETGIGYLQHNVSFDVSPLLDSIQIRQKANRYKVDFDEVETIIYKKVQSAIQNKRNEIVLRHSDFVNIDFSHQNMPTTFSCLFEIIEEDGKEMIVIQNIGGSSAANLLARFCYGNEGVNDLATEIINHEKGIYANKILAEIIHLPESRTGNVLKRPDFRDFEIPYLGQSSLPDSQQIKIEDLILFVKNNRLVLWSKKWNKEVIPRLTNAHNFSHNALPIYQFLCDMQFENCKSGAGFNYGSLESKLDYLPRVTIGNCIVSKAKWIFRRDSKSWAFKIENTLSDTIEQWKNFKKDSNLPQHISLVDGDNTLVINLNNNTCIEMLIDAVKNRAQFTLEEFLFPSNSLVVGKTGCYTNQFIVGLKNTDNASS